MENISSNITYAEAIRSQTAQSLGLTNVPEKGALVNMKRVANRIFEPVRANAAKGKALYVSSFFRSKASNAKAGGSNTSQHCTGEAMDIDADVYGNGSNREVFDYIRKNLEFDQLIWEFGSNDNPNWVHVSLKESGNRKEVLRSIKQNGRTIYQKM